MCVYLCESVYSLRVCLFCACVCAFVPACVSVCALVCVCLCHCVRVCLVACIFVFVFRCSVFACVHFPVLFMSKYVRVCV